MDSVLRRSQTTQKTQRFRHSRRGDKKVLSPSRDSRLPRIEIEDLSQPRYGASTWTNIRNYVAVSPRQFSLSARFAVCAAHERLSPIHER